MGRRLVNVKFNEFVDLRLTNLREDMNKCLFKEGAFEKKKNLIKQVQTIKLTYNHVKELTVDNILFYLNYNTKFALVQFKERTYNERMAILNKLLTIDLEKKANKVHFSDFLIWAANYLYRDEDMAKLVQYFCDNTTYKDSHLIFDVYSVYLRMADGMKCKNIMINKHDKTEKCLNAIKEDVMKSKINL